ncbi:unnamed protein product, partial [Effrenium voratum]
ASQCSFTPWAISVPWRAMDGGDDAGDLHHQPPGWPSFLQGSEDLVQRGGLFDDERLAYDVGSVLAERQIAAERPQLPEDLSPAGGALAPTGIARPETPVMAFVDRASFPGFLDEDEFKCGQSPKHLGRPQVGVGEQSPLSPGAVKLTPRHIESQARPAVPSEPIVGAARLPIAARYREEDWEAELLEWKRKYGCPAADSSPASQGAAPAQPAQPEQPAEPLPSAPSAPSVETGRVASPNPEDGKSEPSGLDAPPRSNEQPDAAAPAAPAQVPSELVTTPAKQLAAELANAVCEERERTEERTGEEPQAMDGETKAPCVPPGRSERPASRRDRAQATLVVAKAEEPPQALDAGRKAMYTQQDLAIATETARSKAAGDNGWMSDFQEAALNVRDFFQDLRKSRDREKGRQATGPLWLHLAAQAKNLADQLDLPQLLEVLKLFCSVRYEDYELYMRLLGEVPHYVKQASAAQLAELARLMARRRLRERNYVDMVVAHLLSKIRVSEDNLSMRLMVKTANALAALECRSQPKFVEHFNRHFEHRIEELDPELCCMVSPVFMVNYMSDALRRSFLKRCAEAQAGFTGEAPIRNLACIELALRKEQHSLVASLPQFVVRYLEKVRAQSEFDKWGSVVLPTTVAPDGPRGRKKSGLAIEQRHFKQREAASSSAGSQRAAAAPAAPAAPAQAPIQGHGSAPISVGTVGHPETCGSACRYVKRKGGCREGTLCLSCHLCFWVRDKEPAAGKAKPEAASRRQMPISSQGTVGHPLNCASPCLAAWSSGGCRAGSMCTKCHRCPPIATHVDLDTVGSRRASFTASSDYSALGDFQSSQVETSVGSAGHPVACNAPCKYAHKLRGCKDGRHCTRCHICRWHKPGPSQLPATRWEPAGGVQAVWLDGGLAVLACLLACLPACLFGRWVGNVTLKIKHVGLQ